MATTNDFDGLLPVVGTFTILSPAVGAVAVDVYGCEDIKLPDREVKKDTYTMINGARTGMEQVILGSKKATTIESKLVFHVNNLTELDALVGVNGCTITLTINATLTEPGVTIAATGGIEKLALDRWQDSQHASYAVTLSVNADWTATPVPVV